MMSTTNWFSLQITFDNEFLHSYLCFLISIICDEPICGIKLFLSHLASKTNALPFLIILIREGVFLPTPEK